MTMTIKSFIESSKKGKATLILLYNEEIVAVVEEDIFSGKEGL